MTEYLVANFTQEDEPLVVIYVATVFGDLIPTQQAEEYGAFLREALLAGFVGELALIWDRREGGLGFYAPDRWRPFMENFSLAQFKNNARFRLRV